MEHKIADSLKEKLIQELNQLVYQCQGRLNLDYNYKTDHDLVERIYRNRIGKLQMKINALEGQELCQQRR